MTTVYTNRDVAPDWTPSRTEGALRLIHFGNLDWSPFSVPVPNAAIAALISVTLSRYDLYLEKQGIREDVMNEGGLNMYEGDGWYEWMGEDGEDFDNDVFDIEMTYQDEMQKHAPNHTSRLVCRADGAADDYIVYAQNDDEAKIVSVTLTKYAKRIPNAVALTIAQEINIDGKWVASGRIPDGLRSTLKAPYEPKGDE